MLILPLLAPIALAQPATPAFLPVALDDRSLSAVHPATAQPPGIAPDLPHTWDDRALTRVAGEQIDAWWAAEGMTLIAAAIDPIAPSASTLLLARAFDACGGLDIRYSAQATTSR